MLPVEVIQYEEFEVTNLPMIDILTEIQQLREQLTSAGHQGRSLNDARLRIFMHNKLRYLEAVLELRTREVARSLAEQMERRPMPR